ncbi:MAG: hypothetical protein ABIR17_01035 [Pseudolysinimonas sp.]|uniref:hypothetical protein n=1 Tax=Pseudolysinimonas sp. TaxID=2680009 RepID=UPI0032649EE7
MSLTNHALPETPARPVRRTSRRASRTRLDAFPRDPFVRWALRLALAVPYLLIAWIGNATTAAQSLNTPNQQLLDHIATIPWDRADPDWISQISPPISTLLATIIPGGRAGLAVAGALVAGIFLQKLIEIMVQRRFPRPTTVILTLAVGANPLFAYTAVENFAAFMGLALFGIAASDVVRFVAWRNTRSGFRAGMLLMLATLTDLSGIVYVITAALATPFVRLARSDQKGARWANVLVIVYPTVAAVGAILALNWIFTGTVLNPLSRGILVGTSNRFAHLGDVLLSFNGLLLVAPVVSAWLIALIVRRRAAIVVSTLVFIAVLGSYVLGLIPSGSAGNTFILMTVMIIALIPTAKEKLPAALVDIVAGLQIVIAWVTAFNREIVISWMHTLTQVFGGIGS